MWKDVGGGYDGRRDVGRYMPRLGLKRVRSELAAVVYLRGTAYRPDA